MANNTPCERCWLRYSSYCIGCSHEMEGLGMTPKEYIEAKAKEGKQDERTAVD